MKAGAACGISRPQGFWKDLRGHVLLLLLQPGIRLPGDPRCGGTKVEYGDGEGWRSAWRTDGDGRKWRDTGGKGRILVEEGRGLRRDCLR